MSVVTIRAVFTDRDGHRGNVYHYMREEDIRIAECGLHVGSGSFSWSDVIGDLPMCHLCVMAIAPVRGRSVQ